MLNKLRVLYARFRNLILYGIIGGFCAGLDFLVYSALCHFDIMPYLRAIVVVALIQFFINKFTTFRYVSATSK